MLTGLMIFGVALVLIALIVRYAVDTTDGRDWMERHVQ